MPWNDNSGNGDEPPKANGGPWGSGGSGGNGDGNSPWGRPSGGGGGGQGGCAQHEQIEMRKGLSDQRASSFSRKRIDDEGCKTKRIENHAAEEESGR